MTDGLDSLWRGHVPGLLGARRSYAVLCPLLRREDGLHLLYEVRASTLRRQPGEVCFPGGRAERGEGPVVCALREAQEELALSPASVEVLGLSDFICNQAGFLLQPVVGLLMPGTLETLVPSPDEVAELFTVPVDFFARTEPERYVYTLEPRVPPEFPYQRVGIPPEYPWSRGRVEIPLWQYGDWAIWGMTARITRDLVRTICGR